MWRPRDRERYIGAYDPEHEMPDPDRGPGDRWQSDAYRRGAYDSRIPYRMNPDRYEDRFDGRRDAARDYDLRWTRDARDVEREIERAYERGFSHGYEHALERGPHYDRGGVSGADRGWDRWRR